MQYGQDSDREQDKDNIQSESNNMKIIDNYRDLSIGMYLDICEIDRSKDIDELHKQVQILSLLTGEAEEDIYNLPLEDYKVLVAKSNYLRKPYEGEILTAKSYKVGDYTLIPVQDFRKITTAQYIDFQTFSKGGEEKVVEVLSTMLVPKGMKYNQGYDVVALQKALRAELSVVDALTLFAFFFVRYRQLIKDSLTFCREEAMKIPDKEERMKTLREIQKQEDLLLKSGDGLHA